MRRSARGAGCATAARPSISPTSSRRPAKASPSLRRRVAVDRLVEGAPLVATIGVAAVQVVDLADAAAGDALDLSAQLHEWQLEGLGELAPERRLARAAQADQGDPPTARRIGTLAAE